MKRYYISVSVIERTDSEDIDKAKIISKSTAYMPTEEADLAKAWAMPLYHALTGVQRMAEQTNA